MWIVPTVITAKCRPKLKFLRYTSWITKMFKIYERNGGGRRSACILISVLENRVSRSYSSDRQINGDQKGSKWSKSEYYLLWISWGNDSTKSDRHKTTKQDPTGEILEASERKIRGRTNAWRPRTSALIGQYRARAPCPGKWRMERLTDIV